MPSIIRTLYNMKSSSIFWNHNVIKFKSRKSKIQIALNGYETNSRMQEQGLMYYFVHYFEYWD